jgi:HEAT repeat protein
MSCLIVLLKGIQLLRIKRVLQLKVNSGEIIMDLAQLETWLEHADFQYRLKAIAALKDYSTEVAVPYLLKVLEDPEFLVRTFIARALGQHQAAESFAAFDNTPSVRAEAANSLSLYGTGSASHLVVAFERDDHWLVRRSILAALCDLNCLPELYEICVEALNGEDRTVHEATLSAFPLFADSPQQEMALNQLLSLAQSEQPHLRKCAARALKAFQCERATAALNTLRQDLDPQVVAATWPSPYPDAAHPAP